MMRLFGLGNGKVAPDTLQHAIAPSSAAVEVTKLILMQSASHVALVPEAGSECARSLVIRRDDVGLVSVLGKKDAKACLCGDGSSETKMRIVLGCVGAVRLLAGNYLVVMTSCTYAGHIRGHAVFEANDFDIVSCASPGALALLSKRQKKDEARYLNLLRSSLTQNTKHLYFSLGYDLTRSFQRQRAFSQATRDDQSTIAAHVNAPSSSGESVASGSHSSWSSADKRFCWNRYAGETLVAAAASVDALDVQSLIVPFIFGSFDVKAAPHLGVQVSVTVIARTSVTRMGIRHHCRGSDADGEVANFVETEQIVGIPQGSAASSFVILRGSVPLEWSQPLRDLFWKFKIRIRNAKEVTPLKKHFDTLTSDYGRVTVVDLLKTEGNEGLLRDAFGRAVTGLPHAGAGPSVIRYVPFDFHSMSRRGAVTALTRLLSILVDEVREFGQYVNSPNEIEETQTVKLQKGVFRVNCKDCLDRTNLVQSAVARIALEEQLCSLGLFGQEKHLSTGLDEAHKHLWASHGDRISIQYSGTCALKRDVTRTGRRTLRGMIQDLSTALTRYYASKFSDGFAQDSLSLWASNFLVCVDKPSPFTRSRCDLSAQYSENCV